MSPVSSVFHPEVTVSTFLKTNLRVGTYNPLDYMSMSAKIFLLLFL